ncbi:MAG: hypothetical protein JWP25_8233 [Bradyrhizobium sp.]|nr:hypothetical protein [Bradyrhizobium sp.]
MQGLRAYVQRDWRGGNRLILVKDQAAGKIGVLSGFTWETYEEGSCFDGQSGLGNADDMIQQILDKAWEAGFRPSGFADVKNETSALREHLADMKAIAFHQLKMK